MRVLVVEDELRMAALIRRGLTKEGLSADVASTGEDALWMARATDYDAIVLDVMLPGIDGFETCRRLRGDAVWAPVLMLTARDSVEDRVAGLDTGADDYLVKPFAFSELVARVRSILRRGPQRRLETQRIGDLEIDLARHRATRGGQRLELTPKEFSLLALLVRRAGEALTRTEIAEQIWDMNFDGGTNVVDVHMHRLRGKVDDPYPQKLLHTVRGVGYVLEER